MLFKRKYFKNLFYLILGLILFLSFLLSNQDLFKVKASGAEGDISLIDSGIYDNYTDYLYHGNMDINDYKTLGYAKKVSIPKINADNDFTITGDDFIVNFIPKEFFMEEGKLFMW